jgi:hypothetical protein
VHKRYNGFETNGGLFLALSVFSAAAIDVYVCTACGYIECYVAGEDELPKIAEKWESIIALTWEGVRPWPLVAGHALAYGCPLDQADIGAQQRIEASIDLAPLVVIGRSVQRGPEMVELA